MKFECSIQGKFSLSIFLFLFLQNTRPLYFLIFFGGARYWDSVKALSECGSLFFNPTWKPKSPLYPFYPSTKISSRYIVHSNLNFFKGTTVISASSPAFPDKASLYVVVDKTSKKLVLFFSFEVVRKLMLMSQSLLILISKVKAHFTRHHQRHNFFSYTLYCLWYNKV